MKQILTKVLLAFALSLCAFTAHALVPPICTGRFVNPMSDLDWNNMYPITVAGVRAGGNMNPILMEAMPPVCACPSILFGMVLPGVGITYWEPTMMVETEYRPGCLASLGGVSVLSTFSMLTSEVTADSGEESQTSRMQIHQYAYPLFAMLDVFTSVWCKNTGSFDLAYMTEIDPTWQDDLWAAVFAPESGLFANPIAQFACAVDAVAAAVSQPLDALFWCSGGWGSNYPFTGNSPHTNNGHDQNLQIVNKFMARQARLGLEWTTIGPTAICSAHPNPILIKSQYRYNEVLPFPRKGSPVVSGSKGLFQFPPMSNAPTQEFTATVLWQGKQCCLKIIP